MQSAEPSIQRLRSKEAVLHEKASVALQQMSAHQGDAFHENILKEDYQLESVLSDTEKALLAKSGNKYFGLMDRVTSKMTDMKKRLIGENYERQNDFYYAQKRKILVYLFQKNSDDAKKQVRQVAYAPFQLTHYSTQAIAKGLTDLQKEDQLAFLDTCTEALDSRLAYLSDSRQQNRGFLIQEAQQSFWSLKSIGNLYGVTLGCLFMVTGMKRVSVFKQTVMMVTCYHLGGQCMTYRVMDRVFDPLYTYFYLDMQRQLTTQETDEIDTSLISQEEISRIMLETKERKKRQKAQ